MTPEEYRNFQQVTYRSFESTNAHWRAGQRRFIDRWIPAEVYRDWSILDVACGDGVGLEYFKELGFKNVTGMEFEPEKAELAEKYGYPVIEEDFHEPILLAVGKIRREYPTTPWPADSTPKTVLKYVIPDSAKEAAKYDLIYSSHSLEHALDPAQVLRNFRAACRKQLILVLPYPDNGPLEAHCAKLMLGTDKVDDGAKVVKYVSGFGFRLLEKAFDNFREPEIWLKFEVK